MHIAFYSIKIYDDKTIQFGFPAWNKRLQPNEIISIEEVPYRPLWEFGGLGWRIGSGDERIDCVESQKYSDWSRMIVADLDVYGQ